MPGLFRLPTPSTGAASFPVETPSQWQYSWQFAFVANRFAAQLAQQLPHTACLPASPACQALAAGRILQLLVCPCHLARQCLQAQCPQLLPFVLQQLHCPCYLPAICTHTTVTALQLLRLARQRLQAQRMQLGLLMLQQLYSRMDRHLPPPAQHGSSMAGQREGREPEPGVRRAWHAAHNRQHATGGRANVVLMHATHSPGWQRAAQRLAQHAERVRAEGPHAWPRAARHIVLAGRHKAAALQHHVALEELPPSVHSLHQLRAGTGVTRSRAGDACERPPACMQRGNGGGGGGEVHSHRWGS